MGISDATEMVDQEALYGSGVVDVPRPFALSAPTHLEAAYWPPPGVVVLPRQTENELQRLYCRLSRSCLPWPSPLSACTLSPWKTRAPSLLTFSMGPLRPSSEGLVSSHPGCPPLNLLPSDGLGCWSRQTRVCPNKVSPCYSFPPSREAYHRFPNKPPSPNSETPNPTRSGMFLVFSFQRFKKK